MTSIRFSVRYLLLTIAIFLLEVAIAVWGGQSLLRTFGGDVLVVVLLYCGVRTWVASESKKVVVAVCAFAFLVEFVQYFDPIGRLGLEDHRVLSIVVGRTFSWGDLLAYTVGGVISTGLRGLNTSAD